MILLPACSLACLSEEKLTRVSCVSAFLLLFLPSSKHAYYSSIVAALPFVAEEGPGGKLPNPLSWQRLRLLASLQHEEASSETGKGTRGKVDRVDYT